MYQRLLAGAGVVVLLMTASLATASGSDADERRRDGSGEQRAVPPRPEIVVGAIAWQKDYQAARDTARDDQLIFVDVYTDWCRWCKHMDQRVFTDPKVRQFASNHVFVKINAEDGGEGGVFALKAGIHSFPTLLVYTHDGQLLKRQQGAFRKPKDLLKWLQVPRG